MRSETASAFEAERLNSGREAPELSRALVELEREITLEPFVRELVKLRASILNGCAYCIDMHTKVARKGRRVRTAPVRSRGMAGRAVLQRA